MLKTKAYATKSPTSPLAPFEVSRREPGDHDVLIEIAYCGVCHSDIHQARDEWGGSLYPMVPGHEIVGRVARVGRQVSKLKVGDRAVFVKGRVALVDEHGHRRAPRVVVLA